MRNENTNIQNQKIKEIFFNMNVDDDDNDIDVEIFINEKMKNIITIDDNFRTEMNSITIERSSINEKYNIHNNNLFGNWSEEDHEIFEKIYKRSNTEGILRQKLTQALSSNLPHKTSNEISEHEGWYRATKANNKRRQEATKAYTLLRDNAINETKVELENFRLIRKEQKEREEKIKEFERSRLELHSRLDELRVLKLEDEQRLQEEERIRVEAYLAKVKEDEDVARAEQLEKKAKVEEYKEIKKRLYMMQQQLLEERAQAAAEEMKRNIDANREKVNQREQLRLDKEELKRKKEEELILKEKQRVEWLNKLAEQVPYWESIQNATSMLDHVTVAVKTQEYHAPNYTRGYMPMNGFANQEIIRDARHRLATALRAAGVQHTQAARDIVARFHPRPHLAVHGALGIL